MKRRFILSTENLTTDQEQQLRSRLGTPYWWHWLPNTWLIVDLSDTLSAASIRDRFREVAPTAQCLVLEVDHKTWAGMARQTPNGRLGDWVNSTWAS